MASQQYPPETIRNPELAQQETDSHPAADRAGAAGEPGLPEPAASHRDPDMPCARPLFSDWAAI